LFTRAFYRHFDSKDALLVGMYRLDATVVVGRLRERIAAAPSARAALEAYIDEYLSLWWDPRKSKRAGILASASARQASGFGEAERISRAELAAPLREVLEAGVASQVFATPSAERDAATICSILWNMRPSTEKKETYGRDRAKADVMRFVLPALGLPE
jgi:AcrR family transcriptional regulator